ncbi:MAG TPA: isoprenylcysteine carboxylmethyltransferase family protein [Thermoanaerobaculia bacterium]|nr:isoprenylcysteine carboxylmethyltransferase family protein [Thermoanaerobaculia bacterium]
MAEPVRVNLVKLTVQTVVAMVVIALALFLPAGTFAWPAGWIFIVLMFFLSIAESVWLIRFNPALMNERLSGLGRKDQATWDKVLMSFVAVAFFGWFALMGLDAVRFRWSHVPAWLQIVGGLVFVASFPIFHAAFRENSFLSPAVRVQTERAQTVVSTGPYARVRHPLYAGFVVFVVGAALLLGSWWGVAGAFVLIVLVAVRAVGEERMLRERLPGYAEYMREVRYRFVPGIW